MFFLELAEGWDDIQDLLSTVILYQHSVDKTILVSQTCLKLKKKTKKKTLLTDCDTFLAILVQRI